MDNMEKVQTKPKYIDYKSLVKFIPFYKNPIKSEEKYYYLADTQMVIFGFWYIIMALSITLIYMPFDSSIWVVAFLPLLFLLLRLYSIRFVYKYGLFKVEWQDKEKHNGEVACENCDKYGDFLDTPEIRRDTFKSRKAFVLLFIIIAGAVALLGFLGYGLAYLRMYNWQRQEMEAIATIAQKYDHFTTDAELFETRIWTQSSDGEIDVLRGPDADEIKRYFGRLKWNYASYMIWSDNTLIISIHGGFRSLTLKWYKDGTPEKDIERGKRLDDHWIYFSVP